VALIEHTEDRLAAADARLKDFDAATEKSRPPSYPLDAIDDFFFDHPIRKTTENIGSKHNPGHHEQTGILVPTFVDARVPVTPRKGQSAADGRAEVQARIAELRAERKRIQGLPLPREEAEAAGIAEIDRQARRGAVNFAGLTRLKRDDLMSKARQGTIAWPKDSKDAKDGFTLAVWLFRDELVERLRADLQARYAEQNSMSVAERNARTAELDAAILAAQYEDESWVELIEAEGRSVQRDLTAPIETVLGIRRVEDEFVPRYEPD
jgi:hypothetical protein